MYCSSPMSYSICNIFSLMSLYTMQERPAKTNVRPSNVSACRAGLMHAAVLANFWTSIYWGKHFRFIFHFREDIHETGV